MKKLDAIVLGIYLLAMIVIYFFWKCKLDPWFTVIALAVVAITTVWMVIQHRKLKEFEGNAQEDIRENA